MTQTREEYLAELQGELESLRTKQAANPSEYKARRIEILEDRLGRANSLEIGFSHAD